MNLSNFDDIVSFMGKVNKEVYGINPYENIASEKEGEIDKELQSKQPDESQEDVDK